MKFAAPAGALYQERGLSTDTTIDAGYAVYLSLAALRRLEPERQIPIGADRRTRDSTSRRGRGSGPARRKATSRSR